MLSKAKGMIKRKLRETGAENQRITRSQSLPSENEGEVSESEEEEDLVQLPCPSEVENLGIATSRVSLYKLNGRETVMTCARMFPDVLPWEVMEMCRNGMSRDPLASAQYFVYYVEQLMRWRTNIREKRTQTIKTLSKDKEFVKAWFHSALIASNPDGQRHCECGLPWPGSHRLPWKHEEHLHEVLDIVCPTPQSVDEWRIVLELVASRSKPHNVRDQPSTSTKDSDWVPDMNWENVVHLALKRLGPSRLVPLLQDVPYQGMYLPVEFYYKCIMGVVIEKEQSNLVHQILTKVDTYLWSKRAGVLTPQDDPNLEGSAMSCDKTLEDAELHVPYVHFN
ncbi:hypothetical protein QZH41_002467 [Actinostola sp. cb2023]|nr:hypothetical protein QZH41_002467 [Actinostola sp. cb2023]